MKKGRKWCLQPLQMYLKVLQEQQTQVHSSIDDGGKIWEIYYGILSGGRERRVLWHLRLLIYRIYAVPAGV